MKKHELRIEEELFEKLTDLDVKIDPVVIKALWDAVEAAEAARNLGEGVEPAEDEEAAQAAVGEPYATARGWYTAPSYHELMNEIRRTNRKFFGRRARFTIKPDGNLVTRPDGSVSGMFVIEVRRAKRES
jgi:hypothetical protein